MLASYREPDPSEFALAKAVIIQSPVPTAVPPLLFGLRVIEKGTLLLCPSFMLPVTVVDVDDISTPVYLLRQTEQGRLILHHMSPDIVDHVWIQNVGRVNKNKGGLQVYYFENPIGPLYALSF